MTRIADYLWMTCNTPLDIESDPDLWRYTLNRWDKRCRQRPHPGSNGQHYSQWASLSLLHRIFPSDSRGMSSIQHCCIFLPDMSIQHKNSTIQCNSLGYILCTLRVSICCVQKESPHVVYIYAKNEYILCTLRISFCCVH